MSRPARSIQRRLLALVLGVVLGAWLASAALTWIDARHELDELLDSHLAQAAALLVVQQAGAVEGGERDVDAPVLHRYASKVAFQVYHEGRLALRSANAPAAPLPGPGAGFKRGFSTVRANGAQWRVFAAHGAENDVQVYVGEEIDSRAAILWAVLRSALWPMALALPLLALAVWWAVRAGLRPLHRLGQAISARQPDALDPIPSDGVPAEMAPMVGALDSLFVRIGTLIDTERRFTADAAHELRTPIAAIRAQAQVALGEHDDARRRAALQNTLAGCDRAARLVDQLLTLSRVEADARPQLGKVDLFTLARQVAAELAPAAIAKQQELEVEGGASCLVIGNETLLGVLIRNLVDNAIRYSPAGASVMVRLTHEAGQFVLAVEDSGPGLTESERAKLGQRFFRVLGSGQSGSGLGWSIAQRIAAVHGFTLATGPASGTGGLAVRLSGKAL